jgi:uncharacterized protein YjbI with pentapeptide repeats
VDVHLSWPLLGIVGGVAVGVAAYGLALARRGRLRSLRISRDAFWLVTLGLTVLLIAGVLFALVPGWVVDETDLSAVDRQKTRTDARTAALALMAGAGAALATLFAGRTYFLTRWGQLSDRSAKAIEQLHSEQEGIRMAAIAALERIAYESPSDHPRVMELLAHFLRNRERMDAAPPADVSAACRALVERRAANDGRLVVDLTGADLRNADLKGVRLRRALLRQARLDGVSFEAADLRGADLSEASAISAQFSDARLVNAVLHAVNLTTATLDHADARHADLREAYLDTASLVGARLGNANLQAISAPFVTLQEAKARGADLTNADCRDGSAFGLDLRGATVDGLILEGANAQSLDLRRSKARGLNLRHAFAPRLRLRRAVASGADFTGADLTEADLTDADLTDAKFDGAIVQGVAGLPG